MSNKSKPCPMCGKAVEKEYRPFCSKRCSQLDLGHWLSERYTVSMSAEEEEITAHEENEEEHL